MTNHLGLPGTEGFPWMWDVLKPGMSQANWNELTTLFSEYIYYHKHLVDLQVFCFYHFTNYSFESSFFFFLPFPSFFSGWGTRVYLWWIHVDIWQNQYNIVKLKNKKKKNEFSFLNPILFLIQPYFRDTVVPSQITARKQILQQSELFEIFCFPVQIKVMFALYCGLISVQQHCALKKCIYLN